MDPVNQGNRDLIFTDASAFGILQEEVENHYQLPTQFRKKIALIYNKWATETYLKPMPIIFIKKIFFLNQFLYVFLTFSS